MVSNGLDVVTTDLSGSWSLKVAPGDMIFVIKPAGWSQIERSAIPSSLWCAAWTEVHDFYLRREIEPETFEVALIADTQASNALELDFVRRELERCITPGSYAFALSHGDVMGDDLSLFAPYRDILTTTGTIWHHCPGNHDLDLDARSNASALDTWKRDIGPTHYAFQFGRATFILLNNVEYFGAGADRVEGRLYRGYIGERQLSFVRNLLSNVPKDDLVVVSMHVPLVSFENTHAPGDNTADRAELLKMLSEFPHTVSFSGHSHTTEHHYLGGDQGFTRREAHHHHVLTAFCGSWWGGPLNENGIPISDSRDGSPRGFHILRVEGNAYQTRFVAAGTADDYGMRFAKLLPEATEAQAPTLMVDVFDGGPRTKVCCQPMGAPGGGFELVRSSIPDPHIVESYAKHRALLKPWVAPAPSSHMWTTSLPDNVGRDFMLEVTDEYGRMRRLQYSV